MLKISQQTQHQTADQTRGQILDTAIELTQQGCDGLQACCILAREFQLAAVPQDEVEQLAKIFGASVGLSRPAALATIRAA